LYPLWLIYELGVLLASSSTHVLNVPEALHLDYPLLFPDQPTWENFLVQLQL
jgi:hypothetical protein